MQATICDLCGTVPGPKDKLYDVKISVVSRGTKTRFLVDLDGEISKCCLQPLVTALASVGVRVKFRGGGKRALIKKEARTGKPRGRPKGIKNKGVSASTKKTTTKKKPAKKKTARRVTRDSEPPRNSKTKAKSEPAHRIPMAKGFGDIPGEGA